EAPKLASRWPRRSSSRPSLSCTAPTSCRASGAMPRQRSSSGGSATDRPPASRGPRPPAELPIWDRSPATRPPNRGSIRDSRYTAAMGAVDTMEVFFEKLNGGDREGAVALMDEQTEMRVHVGDSVQTLRGVDRVGGWFLRGDKGLRMIPGEVRDLGNTYQADILVVRPGAPSQHLDASFRVEAGRITAINLAPREGLPARPRPGRGDLRATATASSWR